MKKLIISLLLFSVALAQEYTVYYPYSVELRKCSTQDIFNVGSAKMEVNCIGIQDGEKVNYTQEIEMIPAPFSFNYIKNSDVISNIEVKK